MTIAPVGKNYEGEDRAEKADCKEAKEPAEIPELAGTPCGIISTVRRRL